MKPATHTSNTRNIFSCIAAALLLFISTQAQVQKALTEEQKQKIFTETVTAADLIIKGDFYNNAGDKGYDYGKSYHKNGREMWGAGYIIVHAVIKGDKNLEGKIIEYQSFSGRYYSNDSTNEVPDLSHGNEGFEINSNVEYDEYFCFKTYPNAAHKLKAAYKKSPVYTWALGTDKPATATYSAYQKLYWGFGLAAPEPEFLKKILETTACNTDTIKEIAPELFPAKKPVGFLDEKTEFPKSLHHSNNRLPNPILYIQQANKQITYSAGNVYFEFDIQVKAALNNT